CGVVVCPVAGPACCREVGAAASRAAVDDPVARRHVPPCLLHVVVNGEARALAEGPTGAGLLAGLRPSRQHVAVEANREIVPRAEHAGRRLADGDRLEVVTFVGGGRGRRPSSRPTTETTQEDERAMTDFRDLADEDDTWTRAGRTLRSRLIVGTGKYRDAEQTKACLERSGAEIVTVALRRVDLSAKDNLLSWIDRDRYLLLPNTAGCYTADEAV